MHKSAKRTLDEIGIARGIDQSSTGHGYLKTYERLLSGKGEKSRVLVVAAINSVAFANTLAEFVPDFDILLANMQRESSGEALLPNVSQVYVHDVQGIHAAIAGFGPFDLLIEDGQNTRMQKRAMLQSLLYHVRDGGQYVVEDLHAIHIARLADGGGPTVLDDITNAWALRLGGDSVEGSSSEHLALGQMMSRVEFTEKLAIITKQGNHAWKLRDAELRTRAPYSRTISTLPACHVQSLAHVRTNNDNLRNRRLKGSFTYPELSLREYANVDACPGQVYFQGSTVLPDSFRQFTRPNMANRNLPGGASRVTIAPPTASRRLSGSFYALDSELPGHFGHVTSEVVSRLWGWEEAKRLYPGIKALVSASHDGGIADWEYELFQGAGIEVSDIEIIQGPVKVERLVAATPMFSQPMGVHPSIAETWNRIGAKIDAPTRSCGPVIERLFIGRKPGASSRLCRNWRELEEKFLAAGFTVVYPEDLPFPDQVALFRNAHTIAGYAGSGMFNLMFAGEAKDVIVIGSESYDAINEYLITSALGGNITYFWCVPDFPQPATGWSFKSFLSDYEFDFERDGHLLDRELAQSQIRKGTHSPTKGRM